MVSETIFQCSCGYSGSLTDYDTGVGDHKNSIFCPNPDCRKEHHIHYIEPMQTTREREDKISKLQQGIAQIKVKQRELVAGNEVVRDMFMDLYRGMQMIAERSKEDDSAFIKEGHSIKRWADLAARRAKSLNSVQDFAQRFVDQCESEAKKHLDGNVKAGQEKEEAGAQAPTTAG